MSQNKILLETLTENISKYKNSFGIRFTLIGGEFNMMPDEWLDRYPSMHNNYYYNSLLKEFLNANSLVDIWRESI